MRRLFYIIPGILTALEDATTWDYRAQAWLKRRFPQDAAAGFNYADGVIVGTLALDSQAALIADDLADAQKSGFSLVIVAHSNGCRLALKALAKAPELEGFELHLIAAAVGRDCEMNGLNAMAEPDANFKSQIASVTLYVSPVDEILSLPGAYGTLGRDGPEIPAAWLEAKLEIVTRRCGHCAWVGRDFAATMELIARPQITQITQINAAAESAESAKSKETP